MKRFIVTLISGGILLILPGIASAHSGSVTCDARGVVFSYNANFASAKTSTEIVNGVSYSFAVPVRQAAIHIVPAPNGNNPIRAGATWGGPGYIKTVTLTCPVPVPPVVPPAPPVCIPGTVEEGVSNGVLVCVRTNTITNTVTVPVEVVRYVTTPNPPVKYKCPKGTKKVKFKNNVLTCLKSKTKTVTKIVIKEVPWKPAPNRGAGGVAG